MNAQEIKPQFIDELQPVMTMNKIMIKGGSTVVASLHVGRIILDAIDVNEQRFADR